jgi:D-psicose/D-tagatose/L-ribulose 3-epimerase
LKIALCNEVVRDMEFAAQCAFAAELGYDSIELAPFTLGEAPHMMPAAERIAVRRAAADAGVDIVSLHWLLVTPKGLHINGPHETVRLETVDVMRRLVGLCADLGGTVMVHGSPLQRDGGGDAAWNRARDTFAAVAEDAGKAGVTYCIEPLSRHETNFINTVAEAVELVKAIDNPAFRTMIDTSAAGLTEEAPVPDLMDEWLPSGYIGHIQVNDSNRRGPGQGEDAFAPVFAALARNNYTGVVAVEPFEYIPDGRTSAARAIGYIKGIQETLS